MELKIQYLREQLKTRAQELGFTLFGISASKTAPTYPFFQDWLQKGFAGEMRYLESRAEAYQHPSGVLEGCRSVIMLGLPYSNPNRIPFSREQSAASAKIAAYAPGCVDYHDLLRSKLNSLLDTLRIALPRSSSRGVVDTAPLLERDFARLAGLGWIGKNTLLIHRGQGSFLFLAAILTDIEFEEDSPLDKEYCGKCQACIEVCPTQALVAPKILDARRCISYLTIELHGPIPEMFRTAIGPWLFGCDDCQSVCPWNRKPNPPVDPTLEPQAMDAKLDCAHWLSLDEPTFRQLYRKTPFWRTRLHGMQRNAMIVAANTHRTDCLPLIQGFLESKDATLRETASWSIQKLSAEHSQSDKLRTE